YIKCGARDLINPLRCRSAISNVIAFFLQKTFDFIRVFHLPHKGSIQKHALDQNLLPRGSVAIYQSPFRPNEQILSRERYELPLPFLFVLQANLHKLIDHYTHPRNTGSLDRKDPSVGSGLVGAPACGDVIRLDIKVDEATGTIVDTRFKTFGCGSAIASSSYLTTLLKGKRCEPSPQATAVLET